MSAGGYHQLLVITGCYAGLEESKSSFKSFITFTPFQMFLLSLKDLKRHHINDSPTRLVIDDNTTTEA
jgi:hypothetical protein